MMQLAASKMQALISKLQPLRSGTAVCLLLTLTALYAAVCAELAIATVLTGLAALVTAKNNSDAAAASRERGQSADSRKYCGKGPTPPVTASAKAEASTPTPTTAQPPASTPDGEEAVDKAATTATRKRKLVVEVEAAATAATAATAAEQEVAGQQDDTEASANGDACAGAAQTPAVPADDGSNASASTKKEQ